MSLALLQSVLLLPIEAMLNRALALDARTRTRLAPHEGRTLALYTLRPTGSLFISVRQQALHLSVVHDSACTATLSGPAGSLLGLLRRGGNVENLHASGLELRGNTAFIQDLQTALRELDPDWEFRLARIFGDVPVALLGDTLRELRTALGHAGSRLHENTRDFLQEESGLLAAPAALESFSEQLEMLTLRLDRLEARIARL